MAVTRGEETIGFVFGEGSFSFDVEQSGDYTYTLIATPDSSEGAGLYDISVSSKATEAPPPATPPPPAAHATDSTRILGRRCRESVDATDAHGRVSGTPTDCKLSDWVYRNRAEHCPNAVGSVR